VSVRLLAALAICACALAACGDDDRYRVALDLPNAGGLRTGSLVQVGGVPVGKVTELDLKADDRVRATLELDADRGPIGRDARAAVASRNLLGEKYVRLAVGNRRDPLPSGALLPAARVQQSVDLDQILDVLGPDTRAKVGVLINEAGAGLTGQGANLNSFLRQLPPSLDKAAALLDEVVNDNHTLGEVVDRSDRFIATLARQRRELGRLVDTAGGTSASFAAKRAELVQTLERAPATLTALRGALAELRDTAPPLRQAARAITASAPALTQTLDELEPFRRAAAPALDELRRAAPSIARLGRRAAPVVRRATPTLSALSRFSTSLAPVTRTLGLTAVDLMATLQGWSRAIQARDGISHMFRAKVVMNPESFNSIVNRLTGPSKKKQKAPARKKPALNELLPALTGERPATSEQPAKPAAPANPVGRTVDALLDFLLGK